MTSSSSRILRLRPDLPYPAGVLANKEHRKTMAWLRDNGHDVVMGLIDKSRALDAAMAKPPTFLTSSAGLTPEELAKDLKEKRAFLLRTQGLIDESREATEHALEARVTYGLAVQHFSWEQNGARIYDFPAPLARAFMDTEFPLTGLDVPFPQKTFYVRAAGCGLRVFSAKGGNPLDGFYVNTDAGEGKLLHILAVGIHPDGAPEDNSYGDFMLLLDGLLEPTLAEVEKRHADDMAGNAENYVRWLRVVVGACAYLAQDKPDVETRALGPTEAQRQRAKTGDKRAVKAAREARLNVTYFRVGWREKLHEHFDGDDAARKLTRRFIVRGHFRQQAHGAGRKERKLVWIKPFWKGPEWGALAANITRIVP